jgi:hypothetical protein
LITLGLKLVKFFFNSKNIEEVERMEYICDEIIPISQSLKKCIYTSKLWLWLQFFGEFFIVKNLSSPLRLIVESRLILTKSELEFQIVVMSILKYFACV